MKHEFVTNRSATVTNEQLLRENAELKKQLDQAKREVRRRSDQRSYFLFYRPYTYVLDFMTAGFLQDVMNREDVVRIADEEEKTKARKRGRRHKPKVDEDGFFLCTVGYLEDRNYIRWERKTQNRIINKLVKSGYMMVKRKGVPAKRWLKILRDQIIAAIDREDQRREESHET